MQIDGISEIPFFDSIEYRVIPYEFCGDKPPTSISVVIRWAGRLHVLRIYQFNNTIIGFRIPYPTVEWIYNPPSEIQIGASKYTRGSDGIYRR